MAYDIRLLKLVSSETVLAKYDEKTDSFKDIAVLQTIPTQQGVQMAILPFGYPFEQEFGGEISRAHVLYEYKNFPEELKTKYVEATSNITLATGGLGGLNLAKPGPGGKISGLDLLRK